MARNDIRPALTTHGGTHLIKPLPMASGAAFSTGEPVVWDGAGGIDMAGDDPASIAGIAAAPSSTTEVSTFIRYLSRAAGTLIPVYDVDDETWFYCENFATDGAGTLVTPTQANAIGQPAGLNYGLVADQWSVDTGSANLICVIEQVVDSRGNSITDPNIITGSGAAVVFRFTFL